MLCTFFLVCTCFCAYATCSDGIADEFPIEITEKFSYCWDNGIISVDADSSKDTLSLLSHHYEMTTMLSAFSKNVREQSEPDKIGYCCRQYYIRVNNAFNEEMKYYNIVILSDMKRNVPMVAELEKLKEHEYVAVNIISEAPVKCIAFMEYDCLIFVTYNMFDDLKDVLSISKSFVKCSLTSSTNP